ncbi:DUF2213 domain-containing protein [Methylobacillus sp.]|uniref:DUF2213 domain-containing protein n=1 Tax=Methylobacillus sp. TaxID=56818 RepID=UPI002FE38977
MTEQALALDASVRTIDANGHLRVAKTVISKAAVNPYYGREIPRHEELGLDPDKIYHLLRDPDEIKQAADTFKGKQLLLRHIPVDSRDTKKEFTIGAIGSDVSFDNGNLYADLTVWDDEGIGLIESKKMQELSAGYSYKPDMTPGEFNGETYDGVMRSIHGNHVALVERGRIGRDAVIADSLPFEMRLNMKLKKGAMQRITAKLGMDEDKVKELVEEVAENIEHKPAYDEAKLKELAGDNYEEIVKLIGGEAEAEDESPEKPEGGADKPAKDEQTQAERDNESEALRLKDREERERKDRDADKAMDADTIAATVEARINAKYAARDAVEPLVGRIAMDGFSDAKAIYEYALKQKGIACDGINEAGLKALVAMQRDSKPAATVAMDSAPVSDLTKRFKQG